MSDDPNEDIPKPEWVMFKLEWPGLPPLMDIGLGPLLRHRMFADQWDERIETDPEKAKEDLLDMMRRMTVEALHAYGYAIDPEGTPTFYISERLDDFVTADEIEDAVTRIEVESESKESDTVYTASSVDVVFSNDIPLNEEEMDRLDLAPRKEDSDR